MSIRTPNPNNSKRTLLDLNRIKERISINQERLSSGRAISRLGDNPTGAALVVDFRASVNKNKAYLQQIDSAKIFLQASETAVADMENVVVRLRELGQQGLTGTLGATQRGNIATEVRALRDNLLNLANSQAQGKYLFAGTQTTTRPFAYNATPATPPAVVYSGDTGSISLDVSLSTSVTTNLSGSQLCLGAGGAGSSSDIFQVVTDFITGLESNDLTQMQSAYDNLAPIHEHLNTMLTELGGRQAGLDNLEESLTAYNLSLKAIQGTYEDLDYPEAITEYYQDMNAQSAALQMLGKRNTSPNLFDYLG